MTGFGANGPGSNLPEELENPRRKWLDARGNRLLQEKIYAEEFGPLFAPYFAKLPMDGAPPDFTRPRFLVSLLGMTWQPVALMGAWVAPEKWLILTTGEARKAAEDIESPISLIRRISGVPEERIDCVTVSDDGEVEIYRAVRKFAKDNGIVGKDMAVDITGGKKSMSVGAGLGGFLAGARIVYVDYGPNYSRMERSPDAGSEFPRLLSDPLQETGDIDLVRFVDAFNAGNHLVAQGIAGGLKERLYEARESECLHDLAAAYAAWDEFRFEDARAALCRALDFYRKHGRGRNWRMGEEAAAAVERHVSLLGTICDTPHPPSSVEQGMPLVLNHLAMAMRLRERRPGVSVMLCYATLEKYVDLCLVADHGLNPENPDYGRVERTVEERRKEYDGIGEQVIANYSPRTLSGPLMFSNGLQLLALLSPERVPMKDLRIVRGLSQLRNKSEYAHGNWFKKGEGTANLLSELDRQIEFVRKFLSCSMPGDTPQARLESVSHELDAFAFPSL